MMRTILIFIMIYLAEGCNITIDEEDPKYNDEGIQFDQITKFRKLKDNLQYSLMPESSVMSIGMNGVIFFKRGLDRERLCQVPELRLSCPCQDVLCKIPLGIWRQRKPTSRQEPPLRWHVVICIKDRNDNRPSLPRTISRSISESTKIGSRIALPLAEDNDSDAFSKTFYKLNCDPNSNMFELVPPNGSNTYPQLETSSALDHEKSTSHSCQLEACENSICSSSSITISVIDENDHSPTWTMSSWNIAVKENTTPNTEVLQLFATDPDSTFNQLTFSIIDGSRQDLFMIESKTGKIRLAEYLDYDTMSSKELYITVKVSDNGPYNPRFTTATVTISIEDVNDNRPIITLENNVISIEENAPPSYLGFMTVSDSDSGQHKMISCYVTEPNDKVTLKPAKMESTYQIFDIYSKVPLDHEVASVITVKITCSDLGSPRLSSDALVTLRITDVDDNDVMFAKKTFVVGIEEEREIGSHIMQLEAVDKDSSSVLEYLLKNKSQSSLVDIDLHQGILRTNMVFDREVVEEIRIEVLVREKHSPNKTDESVVILKILDINDNEPKFEKLYSFSVSEKREVNYEIGVVQTNDPDLRNNGTVVYSQQSNQDNPHVFFFIDQSGRIILFQRLDYETHQLHHMVILASDLGSPIARTSTTTVIISVIDENDNPPVFKQKDFQTEINCHTRFLNRDIYPASDKDTDPKNREMEYQIAMVSPQSMGKYFKIERLSGEISIDFEQSPDIKCTALPKMMKIKMIIFDPTIPELRDHCSLRLTLTVPYLDLSNKESKLPIYKEKIKDNENLQAEDANQRKNHFEYNLLVTIIFVVLSLMLVLLLTCVAVFARKCKQEQLNLNMKLADNEFSNQMPNSTMDPLNRSTLIKPNNIHKAEFQMMSCQPVEDEMAINSLLWDSSDKMVHQNSTIRDDRNDYQLLGHISTHNPTKSYRYSPKYQDDYGLKPVDIKHAHPAMVMSSEKNNMFFSMKPMISTSYV